MTSKKKYAERRAAGLCGQCGKTAAIAGTSRCQKCTDQHRKYANNGRSIRIAKGECRDCGVILTDRRFVRCENCRRINAKQSKKWRATSPSYTKNYFKGPHLEAMRVYGGDPPECACCGEKNMLFLTLDHINNDGAEHRRQTNGSSGKNLAWILKKENWPPGFQVLCFNCNCGKSRNNGVCPHKS